ncbi:MAG: alpha/beta hydrolase [Actinobacteria bacterium]|nr:alpha/beta hydrolase [Actinomycetota bacterium]
MTDGTIELPDGRTLGYSDYGPADGVAVVWCHGGPGSRLEPKTISHAAAAMGQRVIGFDRPGYGLSSPRPGRSIESVVPDQLALADHLGLDTFYVVGVSTGGAYALATAAIAPDRVAGVVACCALTDMRDETARAAMTGDGSIADIWNSTTRDDAIDFAETQFGPDGAKLLAGAADGTSGVRLADADMAMFTDAAFLTDMMAGLAPMFAWGVQGYVDDRLADGPGWSGFDVKLIVAPVVVLHGKADTLCPVVNAHHTAAVVPNATLRLTENDGHFSIVGQVPVVLGDLMKAQG